MAVLNAREKVLAAFALYQEGGSLTDALTRMGLSNAAFYQTKLDYPDLHQKYLAIQETRADMGYDQIFQISEKLLHPGFLPDGSMCEPIDPRSARVAIDAKIRMAAAFDRKRFGERVDVGIGPSVDVLAAISEAKARLNRPQRDLPQIIDAQFIEIEPNAEAQSPDKQSEVVGISSIEGSKPGAFVNPFDD